MLDQPEDMVLIREPGQRHYSAPAPAGESAPRLWEYAALSANVYNGNWQAQGDGRAPLPAAAAGEAREAACLAQPASYLPLDDWVLWDAFPSEDLKVHAERLGLYVEVREKSAAFPPEVAVVFMGTQFESRADWWSNLRWFTRFLPGFEDQYTLLAKYLGKEFIEALAARKPAVDQVRVVATGHSLGGGLAQHFAYALPSATAAGVRVPRVAHVYAFDPSPVTGWYSVPPYLRADNAKGLEIDRVFEHGEILAYLRLLLSYAYPPSATDPAIREIRFNFIQSGNGVANHSMLRLACSLMKYRASAGGG